MSDSYSSSNVICTAFLWKARWITWMPTVRPSCHHFTKGVPNFTQGGNVKKCLKNPGFSLKIVFVVSNHRCHATTWKCATRKATFLRSADCPALELRILWFNPFWWSRTLPMLMTIHAFGHLLMSNSIKVSKFDGATFMKTTSGASLGSAMKFTGISSLFP